MLYPPKDATIIVNYRLITHDSVTLVDRLHKMDRGRYGPMLVCQWRERTNHLSFAKIRWPRLDYNTSLSSLGRTRSMFPLFLERGCCCLLVREFRVRTDWRWAVTWPSFTIGKITEPERLTSKLNPTLGIVFFWIEVYGYSTLLGSWFSISISGFFVQFCPAQTFQFVRRICTLSRLARARLYWQLAISLECSFLLLWNWN